MTELQASAIAHPNIALIKYWGNQNDSLRLPANGSISMNLDGLTTTTTVEFNSRLSNDSFTLNGQIQQGTVLERVQTFLDIIRQKAHKWLYANVTSINDFPTGAGIASSAAAFAALALAGSYAIGLNLSEKELSTLARRGSGSACRSVPGGYVEWVSAINDEESYAFSIAPTSHWDLIDCIAIIESRQKSISSSEGHRLANSSPLQPARVKDCPRRLEICRAAILKKDFEQLTEIVELDSHLLHAVMMTSHPTLIYWQPASLNIMHEVITWRHQGLEACYTLDAGANVHVLCSALSSEKIILKLKEIDGVKQVLSAQPGSGVQLIQAI